MNLWGLYQCVYGKSKLSEGSGDRRALREGRRQKSEGKRNEARQHPAESHSGTGSLGGKHPSFLSAHRSPTLSTIQSSITWHTWREWRGQSHALSPHTYTCESSYPTIELYTFLVTKDNIVVLPLATHHWAVDLEWEYLLPWGTPSTTKGI